MILTDTGPLVALVDRRDSRHTDCLAVLKQLPHEPVTSTWPCFTEAMYFARHVGGFVGVSTLWQMHVAGDLVLHELSKEEVDRMRQLMEKYHDLPMDLADASLIAAAERLGVRRIFTLDSDFHIYRLADGSALEVVP